MPIAVSVMAGAKMRAMLVSAIGLAMNSRSRFSTPAAPVCTHFTFVATGRSAPVRLPKTTSASGSRLRNSARRLHDDQLDVRRRGLELLELVRLEGGGRQDANRLARAARRRLGRVRGHDRLTALRVDRRRRSHDGAGGEEPAAGGLCVGHGREP